MVLSNNKQQLSNNQIIMNFSSYLPVLSGDINFTNSAHLNPNLKEIQ